MAMYVTDIRRGCGTRFCTTSVRRRYGTTCLTTSGRRKFWSNVEEYDLEGMLKRMWLKLPEG